MITLPKDLILSQRDPKWAGIKLGASGLTMGDWGCALTCVIMAAGAFGKKADPIAVIAALNANGGFISGGESNGSVIWTKVAQVLGIDFLYRYETDADPTNRFERVKEIDGFRHVERNASRGFPTPCHVDTNHDGKPNHWVLAIGDGQCIDPWDGQVKPLSTFQRLYGYAIFAGLPAYDPSNGIGTLLGKANEIFHGRGVQTYVNEIVDVIKRP